MTDDEETYRWRHRECGPDCVYTMDECLTLEEDIADRRRPKAQERQ